MSPKQRLEWVALGLALSPLIVLFAHLGRWDLARVAPPELGVLIAVIKVCWDLRSRLLFWVLILGLAVLHVPLIIYMAPRLSSWPSLSLCGFFYVDSFVVILVIERTMGLKTTFDAAISEKADADAGWLQARPQRSTESSPETR